MRRTALTVLLCGLLAATHAFAGDITGTIVFDGKAPNFKPLKMEADPKCASKHDGPVYPETLVLGDGNTMGNVFVQVKNAPAKDYPTPGDAVILDQNGCVYIPHVVGAMVGQAVKFKNSDGILHNVHGQPKVNREFNIGMPPALAEKDQVFNKPEPAFPVKCDVHPWMKSYVAVMTHPYFAITGKDGQFAIDASGLPDGSYEIEAWHERLGAQTAKVSVSGGAASGVDFSFKVPTKN